ncbi:MAG: hypothetical protein KGN77_13855 [Xanthomonadaceae bacterium]|nr:hypothetical protein [Xanthomonadaceae bacterium]MDE1965320.1 hypothetical protein [Xanthomonadaceae bacterium]
MRDTIEMLEAIGQDAGLSHACGGMLAFDEALDGASEALRTAIRHGDSAVLYAGFGARGMQLVQASMSPGREDEPDEDGDEPDPRDPSSPDGI